MEPRLRQPQPHRQIRGAGALAAVLGVEADEDGCVEGGGGAHNLLPALPSASPEPANIEGNAEAARVVGLTPWMDYDFQVIASNILGSGEPSTPSPTIRTQQAGEWPQAPPTSPTCEPRS